MILGSSCPPGYKDNDGKTKGSFKRCINNCKNKCLPEPVLNVLFNRIKTDHHVGNYISATALQGCMRSTYLQRTNNYYIRPSDRHYDSLRGTLIHSALEGQDKNKYLIEKDFYYSFNELETNDHIKLFGRVDLYNLETGVITDFKTIKDMGFQYLLKSGNPKDDHVWQANIYKFLLENGILKTKNINQTELFNLPKFKVNGIKIIYMCMKGASTTGSTYKVKERGLVNEYKIEEIPLLSDDKILKYIEDRIYTLYRAFKYDVLPPEPDKDTQTWLCGSKYNDLDGYCDVKHLCPFWQKLADEKGIKY